MANGLLRESIGYYTGLGQRILVELNPNILVRDAIRMHTAYFTVQVTEGLVELVGMMEEVLEHHQIFLEGKEVGGVQAVQCSEL